MSSPMVDAVARDIALNRWALPECLHVPVAAVDQDAIAAYVGDIVHGLAKASQPRALLVRVKASPELDPRLPIWSHERSAVFHQPLQVWVHVSYTRYRQAYRRAFPAEDIEDQIVSHAVNRRVAALQGFQYVRVTPVSRGSNSSSAFSERWAVSLHISPEQVEANRRSRAFIRYADLTELMLMLDIKLGGGVMDVANEGQKLVRPRPVGTP